jgi:hypothetical protein
MAWFVNVVNMDETKPEIKEEDIQIPLDNGLLVVEIKVLVEPLKIASVRK